VKAYIEERIFFVCACNVLMVSELWRVGVPKDIRRTNDKYTYIPFSENIGI